MINGSALDPCGLKAKTSGAQLADDPLGVLLLVDNENAGRLVHGLPAYCRSRSGPRRQRKARRATQFLRGSEQVALNQATAHAD